MKTILIILLVTQLFIVGTMIRMTRFIYDSVVYDIDVVRDNTYTRLKHFYLKGCLEGVESVAGTPVGYGTVYNDKSPMNECNRQMDEYEEYFRKEALLIHKVR